MNKSSHNDMLDKTLLSAVEIEVLLHRLACQLLEVHLDFSDTVIIGLQPRGIPLAERLCKILTEEYRVKDIASGQLDITFFRDDFRHSKIPVANKTHIECVIEDKKVVFVDDVLYTGRSIRAALTAIQTFGRPADIELLIMIDRRFSRHLPIQPTYKGIQVDAFNNEYVQVCWKEKDDRDLVYLTSKTTSR